MHEPSRSSIARPRRRPAQSRGQVSQRPGRAAGLCQRIHVVQLIGGPGRERSGRGSRGSRTKDDPRADSRSAEARTRVEADYAAVSIARTAIQLTKKGRAVPMRGLEGQILNRGHPRVEAWGNIAHERYLPNTDQCHKFRP
jgi:hypothetical protein